MDYVLFIFPIIIGYQNIYRQTRYERVIFLPENEWVAMWLWSEYWYFNTAAIIYMHNILQTFRVMQSYKIDLVEIFISVVCDGLVFS